MRRAEPELRLRDILWPWGRLIMGVVLLAFQPSQPGWRSGLNLCLGVLLVAMGAAELEYQNQRR